MRIKPDGYFTEFEMAPQEEEAALSSPYLLAYLQSKRAAYAAAFMEAQLTSASQGEFIELERQRAKIQMLSEIINEVVQSQAAGPSEPPEQSPEQ